MGRQWEPIRDYTGNPLALAHGELRALEGVWREQRGKLADLDAFQRFNVRLKREWAIETGLIEHLYVLDRGITQLLIDHGINASLIPHGAVDNPEAVTSMIGDHEAVVDGIFEFVKGDRSLTIGYVKEVHALITRHQDTVDGIDSLGRKVAVSLISGDYKRQPNNPRRPDGELHEYCPPEHVASEMERLVDMHHRHQEGNDRVPPEVEAAWLHHRFAQIHPFQDGNGRVARALATLVFVKSGWFPLVVRNEERETYIEALEAADGGDLGPLVGYFASLQRDEFIKALSIARDVLESARAEEAIRAVRRQLQRRKDSLQKEWQAARVTAGALCTKAEQRLRDVAEVMEREMGEVFEHPRFFADSAAENDSGSHYSR